MWASTTLFPWLRARSIKKLRILDKKGKHRWFLSKDSRICLGVSMGNTYKDRKGYPRWKDSGNLVHRTVASNKVRGHIGKGRVVHHKDGNKSNFRKSNLTVMSRSAHSKLHKKKRRNRSRKN